MANKSSSKYQRSKRWHRDPLGILDFIGRIEVAFDIWASGGIFFELIHTRRKWRMGLTISLRTIDVAIILWDDSRELELNAGKRRPSLRFTDFNN